LPAIVKRIQPSTVSIITYDSRGDTTGQGSGFVVGDKGDIITNYHVVRGASSVEVKLPDGQVYSVKAVVAEDEEGDLVRLSSNIPSGTAKPLSVRVSLPEVGERVVVIGSPLGLEHTVSDGIVSAVRSIQGFGEIIQLTAPTSPGSSGSPVVNMKGEVIGVASFQALEGQNLNFAIPGQRVAKLVPNKTTTFAQWNAQKSEQKSAAAEQAFSKGLLLLWSEDYAKALLRFLDAVKTDADAAEAWFYIGACHAKLGVYHKAVGAFKKAIRIAPDYVEAHHVLGYCYAAYLGRDQDAIAAYKQVIRVSPDNARVHYDLGRSYARLCRHEDAVAAYKQAVRINPDYADAHFHLGLSSVELGKHRDAIVSCRHTIRVDPNHIDAYVNLGYCYEKLGRHQDAVVAYKQAIRINPEHVYAHTSLGSCYNMLGRHQDAIAATKQAIRIDPSDAAAHAQLGLIYFVLGDRSSALEAYEVLRRLNPAMADELFDLMYE